ncbi:MAG: hypothetical protein Unbinned465contig1000_9 [Prokaryotic dsDNA virus sp.]|nr:MAG: hypothetical protein Unbinned465contig1000_9 [Prokaryotic dsDNA virus sp.]|tara:strand:+ start:426 stop:1067 length:642 start_codon:yes stop_codon:yes gene_type:complete
MEQVTINDGFTLERGDGFITYNFNRKAKQTMLGKHLKDHLKWYPKARTQGNRKFLEIDHFDREVWGRRMWVPRDATRTEQQFGLTIQKSLDGLANNVGGYNVCIRCRPEGLQEDMARAGDIGFDTFSGTIELGANRVNYPTVIHELSHLLCYPHANHGNAFGAAYLLTLRSYGFPTKTLSRTMGRNSLCYWAINQDTNDRLRKALDVGKEVIP